jgi:hypothetical protein
MLNRWCNHGLADNVSLLQTGLELPLGGLDHLLEPSPANEPSIHPSSQIMHHLRKTQPRASGFPLISLNPGYSPGLFSQMTQTDYQELD